MMPLSSRRLLLTKKIFGSLILIAMMILCSYSSSFISITASINKTWTKRKQNNDNIYREKTTTNITVIVVNNMTSNGTTNDDVIMMAVERKNNKTLFFYGCENMTDNVNITKVISNGRKKSFTKSIYYWKTVDSRTRRLL